MSVDWNAELLDQIDLHWDTDVWVQPLRGAEGDPTPACTTSAPRGLIRQATA